VIARSHPSPPIAEHPSYGQRELIPSQMLDQIWTAERGLAGWYIRAASIMSLER
jgi:hypothetical protein